jgi:hypothetical protein
MIQFSNIYFLKEMAMQRINLLCPTIRRQSRKIGRNEPCPCGATKTRFVPAGLDLSCIKRAYVSEAVPEGSDTAEVTVETPVKYKHCHGNITKQRKATKVHNFLRKHFAAMLNRPSKVSKLKLLAEKVKSLFSKNRS